MSFFNLTVLGYDNQFKSMKHLEPVGTDSLPTVPTGGQLKSPLEKQLAREMSGDFQSREWVSPSISNLNYHSLRHMHVRSDQDSNQTVRRPLTAAQEIGWWKKDEPLKVNEPWTYQKRFVHGQSEMTKFVDDMLLNRPIISIILTFYYYYYIEKKKKNADQSKNIKYLNIAQY